MAKRVTELNGALQPVTYRVTKAMRRSEQKLIPFTPAAQTRWERIKRAAVG